MKELNNLKYKVKNDKKKKFIFIKRIYKYFISVILLFIYISLFFFNINERINMNLF